MTSNNPYNMLEEAGNGWRAEDANAPEQKSFNDLVAHYQDNVTNHQ